MLQCTLDNKAPKATAEETTQGNSRIVQLLGFCNMKYIFTQNFGSVTKGIKKIMQVTDMNN